jgi:hypothetical protein
VRHEHILNFLRITSINFERRNKNYYSKVATFGFLYSLQQHNTCAEMTTAFSNVCVCVCVCLCLCFEQLSCVEEDVKFVSGLHVPTRGMGGVVLPS